MSVQRRVRGDGKVRYRARVKWQGVIMADRTFTRRSDAKAWENDQVRRLRLGEWIDPERGRVRVDVVAQGWLGTRHSLKRRTAESDRSAWRLYIEPTFGKRPINSITAADVREWTSKLIADGLAASTAARALSTFRSIFQHAIADERLTTNPAAAVPRPRGPARREGRGLSEAQLAELVAMCRGDYAELVLLLGYTGLRWGELAGLRVADVLEVPGPGLRVERTVLASNGGGQLYIDTAKTGRARTVPLAPPVATIPARWMPGKSPGDPLFSSPNGGFLRESNWKRAIHWTDAKREAGLPELRVHDLRHTAATVWLASGADPKVVQRILGHATATMTLDLYGHLIDESLWAAARRVGDPTGTPAQTRIGGNHDHKAT